MKEQKIKMGGFGSPQPETLPRPKVLPGEPSPEVLPDEDEIWGVPEPKVLPKPKA